MAESRLKIDVRRNRVLDVLRRDGRVCVSELSRSLGATPVTIRNDLAALERDGHLVRVSGGAVLAQQVDVTVSVESNSAHNAAHINYELFNEYLEQMEQTLAHSRI